MGRLFGTDGVRGVANDLLTSTLAAEIGKAGAWVLSGGSEKKVKILIGRDTRVSGQMLEAALTAGICSVGADVYILGVAPTPAVAYLTKKYGFDAGVVVSASHNSFEFNGIKFFDKTGYKLPDETENEIEAYILGEKDGIPTPTGEKVGCVHDFSDKLADYIEKAVSTASTTFNGKFFVLDCANGASYNTAKRAFEALGARVEVLSDKPDGVNINDNCGSTHMENLQKKVIELNADAGFAFDGDADRMLAVDENGNIVDGDVIMAICANSMKKKGTLKNNTLVATVMSNLGLFIMGEKFGIDVLKTKVGDRYVLEEMLKGGHAIGGEQSGHVIFLDHNTTGDGLVSAIALASVMCEEGKQLSALTNIIDIYPQVLKNARVAKSGDNSYSEDTVIMAAIGKLEEKFSGEGRVLIRLSGTEPLVRVMIEGKNQDEITRDAIELAKLIEERLS
ncbi:MAG: phosphoglucosamine mutase [Clostridia bacterium]|nr:phosphoglucosamine mutase [Clostridia bacterium]